MKINLINIIKYILILGITAGLLWWSLTSIEVAEGQSRLGFVILVWNSANKPFIFLSGVIAIISHLIRAERWKLLLNPMGHPIGLGESFLSVMVGYFVNLIIPRGGELSRPYNLYRLNKTPIDVSFGTVLIERVVDFLFLVTLIGISSLIELDALIGFFRSMDLVYDVNDFMPRFTIILAVLTLVAVIGLTFRILLTKKRGVMLRLLAKFRKMFRGIKEGIKAVSKLEKRGLFIFYSLLIWVCYYLMSYAVMMSFPDTASLSLLAALTIFVIGGIAMTMPLPGGTGSYHVLVPAGLVFLYSIPQDKAVAFTVIFHGWHTLIIIVVGALALFISQYKSKHKIYAKNRK